MELSSGPNVAPCLRLLKIAIRRTFRRDMAEALNVNLTAELRRFIKDQVRSGRYQNENEVVRDALRQMQQHEIEQFERVFGNYSGAPSGEPTAKDDAAISAAVRRYRNRG